MSDIEINIGYIGKDIVALCDDTEASYAFHAEFQQETGNYLTRLSSSHGLITTGRFNNTVNARQMVMIAMSKHLDVVTQREQRRQEKASRKLPADPDKVH